MAGRAAACRAGAFLLAASTLVLAQRARAALGEPEASVAGDRRALVARSSSATDAGAYRVHELVTGGGTVREYVGADGVVFAVTWSGVSNPDLGRLLGAYAGEYRAAARQAPRDAGRRSRRVEGTHVVVDRWGHMRDRHGRAFLPDRLPPGVSADDLQ